MQQPKRLVLFASGSGSNAENVCKYFANNQHIKIVALFCNNHNAGVLQKMENLNIPTHVFSKNDLLNTTFFLNQINQYKPDLIVLLGFLLKIPNYLVKAYPNKIVNLHPALLPKYGGKGMYGHYVHQAVKNNNEKETGITIHYVNQNYDEGNIIKQFKTSLEPTDSVDIIAAKIASLEMANMPKVLEELLA